MTAGRKVIDIDQFNNNHEQLVQCIGGRDKVLISPILNWTENDVWDYIRHYKLPYCSLYDKGFTRIGCIFCPMAKVSEKRMSVTLYPGIMAAYKRAIQYVIDNKGFYDRFRYDPDIVFEWWISNKSADDFMKSIEKQEKENGPEKRT